MGPIYARRCGLFVETGVSIPDSSVTISPRVGLNNVPEPWKSVPWRFQGASRCSPNHLGSLCPLPVNFIALWDSRNGTILGSQIWVFPNVSQGSILAEEKMTKLLQGKKALIFGVANERSIAWGIAKAFSEHGAQVGLSYAAEALERRVRPLAESIACDFVEPCDLSDDSQIHQVAERAGDTFGGIDILVHAVAFANRDELTGPYYNTSREGFRLAMDISVYSFTALAQAFQPLLRGRLTANPDLLRFRKSHAALQRDGRCQSCPGGLSAIPGL
jgi:hypothetical protein